MCLVKHFRFCSFVFYYVLSLIMVYYSVIAKKFLFNLIYIYIYVCVCVCVCVHVCVCVCRVARSV